MIYKHFCFILTTILFLSCIQASTTEKETNNSAKSEPNIKKIETYKPKNILEDSTNNSIDAKNSTENNNHYEVNEDTLEKFLTNPLDFQEFKKIKGQSNSGGFDYQEYLFKPDYQGFYLRFFIFPKFGEHGPRIVSYRKGKNFGDFFEDRDTIIQLFSDRPDKDLKNANLVHKHIDELKRVFGDDFLTDEDFIYYRCNKIKTLLTIYTRSSQRVLWFKVTRLNKSINSIDDIPQNIKNVNAS
ncbi:MAG: hypothetical protein WEA99_05840 [Brumimicrobium sp.]